MIDHVGHRGDGVASASGESDLRALHAARRDGRGRSRRRSPRSPRGCLRSTTPAPSAIAPFCPHFGVCGGCAMQHWADRRAIAPGSAISSSRHCAQAGSTRRRAADRRPRRGPPPRHRACAARQRMTCSRSASPPPARTTSCRSTAARFSTPPWHGALDAAWAIAEALDADPASRSTSKSPRPTPASTSMCAAPGRCRRR